MSLKISTIAKCFILSLILLSCNLPVSVPKDENESSSLKFKDTAIDFVNGQQNIKIFYDKDGCITLIQSKNSDSVQSIFLNKSGTVSQLQNHIKNKEELITYFNENGQIIKIKKFDDPNDFVNDTYIWFVPSPSKNLTINLDKVMLLGIAGMEDTFLVHKDYILEIKDFFYQGHHDFELKLNYDTNNVILEKIQPRPPKIKIQAKTPGQYRVKGVIRFSENNGNKENTLQGIDHKIDITLIFK